MDDVNKESSYIILIIINIFGILGIFLFYPSFKPLVITQFIFHIISGSLLIIAYRNIGKKQSKQKLKNYR